MNELTTDQQAALAVKLQGLKRPVAESVTREFFQLHPDWNARYGERGRQLCIEDECLHVEFLAGAVGSGITDAFVHYVRWTAGVLSSRGIEPHYLAEALGLIGQELAARLPEAESEFVAGFLDSACAALTEIQPGKGVLAPSGPLALIRDLFLQALLQGRRKPAYAIALEAVRQGHPVIGVYAEVLGESLREVGRLWESNRITVAAEHTATAIVQFVLAQLYPLLPATEVHRGNAVITGVEGELHQVGANMVADVLEADGWNVRFLGTNMPHAGVLQIVEEHRADAVGITAATLLSLPKVRCLVFNMREKFKDRCPRIIVGGGAFRFSPTLVTEVGADAYGADLLAAPALFTDPSPA